MKCYATAFWSLQSEFGHPHHSHPGVIGHALEITKESQSTGLSHDVGVRFRFCRRDNHYSGRAGAVMAFGKKRSGPKATPEEEAIIIQMYEAHTPYKQIAAAVGRPTGGIKSIVSRIRLPPRDKIDGASLCQADLDIIIAMRNEGWTFTAIANRMGRSAETTRMAAYSPGSPFERPTTGRNYTPKASAPGPTEADHIAWLARIRAQEKTARREPIGPGWEAWSW